MTELTRHTVSSSPWTSVKTALPPTRTEVVAWLVGFRCGIAGDITFKREGKAFMVRWDNAPKETGVDGWSDRFMDAARKKLDADSLEVTHWMLADKPEPLSDEQEVGK